MNNSTNFFRKIFYGKVGETFYQKNKELLSQTNYKTIKVAMIFTTLVCTAIFLLSFTNVVSEFNWPLYLSFSLFYLVLTLVFCFLGKSRQILTRIIYIIFEIAVFSMVIVTGTIFSKESFAVMFFVCLIIFPLLMVGKPIYSIVMTTLVSIVFICFSITIKERYYWSMDSLNTICCYLLSNMLVFYVRNMYFNSIQATMAITEESQMDELTGLYKKAYTAKLCKEYLETKNSKGALLVIDIDNFKLINDTWGHNQGDAYLARIGNILKNTFTTNCIVGRFGGDEFVVLLKNVSIKKNVIEKTNEILKKIEDAFSEFTVQKFTCSVGIAYFAPKDGLSYKTLFFRADQALYHAKKKGKNRYAVYTDLAIQINDQKPLLLVVDDDEISRTILGKCFESDYTVLEANNGLEAIDYLKRYNNSLQAMLLDIEMPIMNGYEVLNYINENLRLKSIPILIITAHEDNDIRPSDLGASDIITKPLDTEIVKQCVKNAINQKTK